MLSSRRGPHRLTALNFLPILLSLVDQVHPGILQQVPLILPTISPSLMTKRSPNYPIILLGVCLLSDTSNMAMHPGHLINYDVYANTLDS